MTAIESDEEVPVAGHVTMVYQGPVAPHWEMQSHFGEQKLVEAFWTRVYARLLLLPKHDPQFRRNRERVNRDAEREHIVCDWDLGEGDAETTQTTVVDPANIVPSDHGADEAEHSPDEVIVDESGGVEATSEDQSDVAATSPNSADMDDAGSGDDASSGDPVPEND